MQISQSCLNQNTVCTCGRLHSVAIETVVVDDNFETRLHTYLVEAKFQRILVVGDLNTYEILGQRIDQYLHHQGLRGASVVFPIRQGLHPDEESIRQIRDAIAVQQAQVVLAVGSGVINDVVRFATYQERIPYISVATAPSMDGYASGVAALQFAGVKTTFPAQVPIAIFAAPQILAQSPWPLIQSGFGDLLGKIISLLDWKLSHILYGEYFCSKAYDMVVEPLKYCLENATRLRERDQEAMQNLFIGLINSGIAMAMVGNSRPCSGSEHHCSHYWDLLAYKGVQQPVAHGLQVGYATHWMIHFYRLVSELQILKRPEELKITPEWENYVTDFYGPGAQEIFSAQRDKQQWMRNHPTDWSSAETLLRLKNSLQPELAWFAQAEQSLLAMGIEKTREFLGLDEQRLRETFLHAKELRQRYTVFDFLHGQGLLESSVQRILSETT